MKSRPALALASLVLALAASRGLAQAKIEEAKPPEVTLHIGDAAPALKVGQWVKGEPVEKFAPGTIYVVECWATWCGPCKQAIPHVTELQKKFDGKVVFVGVDVWEQDDSLVEPFVKEMGDKMNYRVAMDDKSAPAKEGEMSGAMAKSWLQAAGQNGIPCSFVVDREGKIAWIGHPMEIETVLDKVVAGTFDMKAAKLAAMDDEAKAKLDAENNAKIQSSFTVIAAAAQKGDVDAALKAVDQLAIDIPGYSKRVDFVKFQVLLVQMKQYDRAYAMADKALDAVKDDPEALDTIATAIATGPGIEKRDLAVALKFAQRAMDVTRGADPTTTIALGSVYVAQGAPEKAEALVNSSSEQAKPELLNGLAWGLATAGPDAKPDLATALKFATQAVELTHRGNGAVLDTLARVYFLQGNVDKAIEVQTEAVSKTEAPEKEELQKTLDDYKKAKK